MCSIITEGFPRNYTVDPTLLPSGNPFKCHAEVLYLQPMIPPKRFDIFSPLAEGCSLRRSRCVQTCLYNSPLLLLIVLYLRFALISDRLKQRTKTFFIVFCFFSNVRRTSKNNICVGIIVAKNGCTTTLLVIYYV